ncbi:Transcription factor GLABRA 3, partial [Ananas comosus]
MAAAPPTKDESPEEHFRKQLAATVRQIQWSYAIFWSISTGQQGVLSWMDGYYNGDIKTRKTTQPMEFKADLLGLERSEQLRELYDSLSAGDSNQQNKRPSASLSPEDLTDTEWYYLVCMSFTFGQAQGLNPSYCTGNYNRLPGRALASNQHLWLSNAQYAESKIFSRSLLAKTVVCIPFMNGVLELGTTELVLEDPSLIQQVTTSFWDLPYPTCSEQSRSASPKGEKEEVNLCSNLHRSNINAIGEEPHLLEVGSPSFPFPLHNYENENEELHNKLDEVHVNLYEELNIDSTDDSLRVEVHNSTSQVHGRQLMDDEFSNGLHGSLNSSDCISQSFLTPQRIKNPTLFTVQEGELNKLTDLEDDASHYARTLVAILRNSKQSAPISCPMNGSHNSSFSIWMRGFNAHKTFSSTPQKLLKKVLIDTAWTPGAQPTKPIEENGPQNKVWKSQGDDAGVSHVLSERRRREKLNEKFLILRNLVPSISKFVPSLQQNVFLSQVDKASILGDTIEYLRELEQRVEELESCRELLDHESRTRRKYPDIAERTSDNYCNKKIPNGQVSASKRKASDINETDVEHHWILSKDGPIDVNVTVIEKEVFLEIRCPWRECLLLEIVEVLSNLHLDPLSMQSSTADVCWFSHGIARNDQAIPSESC